MAVPLRVTVSPERMSAASGDSSALVVTVRNTSDIVDHYEIDVTGLPEGGSVRTEPDVTKLRPGETGQVTVHLTLVADPPVAAGEHILGVVVRSRYRRDVSRCEEVALTIAPIDALTLRIEPELVTGGRFAHYSVAVTNSGNKPVVLRLASTDPERHVAASFQPATLDLLPGASAQSTMSVSAPIPWGKEQKRTLKIKADGTGVSSEASATFVQRPRLAPGVTRMAGVLGAVLVLAAAIVTAAMIGGDDNELGSTDAATPAITTPVSGIGGQAPSLDPSGGATSEPPPSVTPSIDTTPQKVELVPPEGASAGFVVNPARFKGITLSGIPTSTTGPCSDATEVVVQGDAATTEFFLTSASKADPNACNDQGVQIRFDEAAASVEVSLIGEGGGEMWVTFKDGGRILETATEEKKLTADGRGHQGIDFINIQMLRPSPEPSTAPLRGGAQSLEYTPMATS